MNTASQQPLLLARGVDKRFPGVLALDSVDFTLRTGEIHALMGENGAGKSTLIKVITGVYPRDAGQILLEGAEVHPRSPKHAQELGISCVFQEVNLVPTLSVAENIALGRQPSVAGVLKWGEMRRRAQAALRRLDIELDVRRPLSSYSIAIQQMVAIARALDIDARVLILDESTSSLDQNEVKRLFDSMRKLRDQGLGIVFVTHFLDQVYEVSDRITVLRNGRLVGEFPVVDLPRLQLIGHMVGRDPSEIAAMSHTRQAQTARQRHPYVTAERLHRTGAVESVDIDVAPGEVVSLAGLLGSGRTETARLLFGADRTESGTLVIDGKPTRLTSPRQAIALRFGFCPEDRKIDGIIPDLSIRENIILVIQARMGWFKRISRARQNELADRYIAALKIATPDAEKPIKLLSGGNQQKALLARWLASEPRLLILDEPTRGIDVGAKFEIARLLEDLRSQGVSILFISSELEEVVRIADRVVVMRDRHSVGRLAGDEISEHVIMQTIASESESEQA